MGFYIAGQSHKVVHGVGLNEQWYLSDDSKMVKKLFATENKGKGKTGIILRFTSKS